MGKNLSYTGVGLDRAASFRRDDDWIAERLSAPETLIVPVWRNRNLIRGEGTLEDPDAGIPESVFLSGKGAEAVIAQAGFTVFLGLAGGSLAGGTAYFAADLSDLDEDASQAIAGRGRFEDLRRVGALMAGPEASILAYARGLAYWHQRHMILRRLRPPDGKPRRRPRQVLRQPGRPARPFPAHRPGSDHAGFQGRPG